MNIVCFYNIKPNLLFINLCKKINNYLVYIFYNDNYDYKKHFIYQNHITIIDINLLDKLNYKNLIFSGSKIKEYILYYICNHLHLKYNHIWLIDKDYNLFYSIEKYDLLYNESYHLLTQNKGTININYQNPSTILELNWKELISFQMKYLKYIKHSKYHKLFTNKVFISSNNTIMRISPLVINQIKEFVKIHKTLFIDTIFFINLVKYNKLPYKFILDSISNKKTR